MGDDKENLKFSGARKAILSKTLGCYHNGLENGIQHGKYEGDDEDGIRIYNPLLGNQVLQLLVRSQDHVFNNDRILIYFGRGENQLDGENSTRLYSKMCWDNLLTSYMYILFFCTSVLELF